MKTKKIRLKLLAGIMMVIACICYGCTPKESMVLTETEGLQPSPSSEAEDTQDKPLSDSKEMLLIHICGEVQVPGVYELEEGARVCHAVEAAGGFTGKADETYINQAGVLADGMQLYIPTKEEAKQLLSGESRILTTVNAKSEAEAEIKNGLVNINTASEEVLCSLPGIGSERAGRIIKYRNENGPFIVIEDIMKVSGIKEGMFRKMKDKICV